MREKLFVEEASGEEYLHKTAWMVVRRQLSYAEANPVGAQLDHLVALVFAAHALEGYLNYLGEKVASDLWKDERVLSKTMDVAGKLDALYERCGLPLLDRSRRPWSTVKKLTVLRNRMAHPRTRMIGTTTEYCAGKEPPLFAKTWLDGFVDRETATRTTADVKEIVDQLNGAAIERYPSAGLLPDGLEGILSTRSTSGRLAGER